MIHPDLRVHNLHPEGTAHLQGLFGARQWSRREIHVLHSAGKVVNAVDTVSGMISSFAVRIDNPQAEADRLLASSEASRVVIVDADRLDDFASSLPDVAKVNSGQAELLWAANRAFWSHPAVVTAPPPVTPPWPQIAAKLREVAARFQVVVALYKEDEPYCDFIATIDGGMLVEVTSSLGIDAWPWKTHEDLVAAAEDRGPVPIAMVCEMKALEDLFAAPDAATALVSLPEHPGVRWTRGFDLLVERGHAAT